MGNLISCTFPFKDKLLSAISRLKDAGISDLEVKMPVPDHDVLDALEHKPTRVGWFTLIGGISGMTIGLLGPAWAHMHWGNIIGGKPVFSFPPFVVIMFELTILLGALFTLAGLFMLSRIPSHSQLEADKLYDPKASDDCYCLYISATDELLERAKTICSDEGAMVRS
jgi:hypothetical protein